MTVKNNETEARAALVAVVIFGALGAAACAGIQLIRGAPAGPIIGSALIGFVVGFFLGVYGLPVGK